MSKSPAREPGCDDKEDAEARRESGLSVSRSEWMTEASMIKRFIDVGIAVKDLEAAIATYSRVLGVTPRMLGHADYAYPRLKGARFYLGNATISLVASDDPQSPIAEFINMRGEGFNHISLEVANLEEDIDRLTQNGVELLTLQSLPFPEGRVVFAHPRSLHGVQIAFVQPSPGVDLLQP